MRLKHWIPRLAVAAIIKITANLDSQAPSRDKTVENHPTMDCYIFRGSQEVSLRPGIIRPGAARNHPVEIVPND
jgi:hypothetical protein